MSTPNMSFGGEAIARGYDQVLVPVMFSPWAEALLEQLPPQRGSEVLDLASGTGIVAEKILVRLQGEGNLIAVDLNPSMMELAKARCEGKGEVEWQVSSAEAIDLPDVSVDTLYCQQGFQFFPDRLAAAREIYRLLKQDGQAALSCWRPGDECPLFGCVMDTLREMGEEELAGIIGRPFNHISADEMKKHFEDAGFGQVQLEVQERPIVLEGGIDQGIELAWATPIGPKLTELSDERQQEFNSRLKGKLEALVDQDGKSFGDLASLMLVATK